LVCGERISSVNQILPAIDIVMKEGRSFLIVCDEMDENVNTTLVINTLSGALRCCVVKGIDFGDSRKNIMADISVACGGTYVSQESGVALNDITHEDLGSANKVIVGRDSTIIIEGFGDPEKIEARTKILKERLKAPEMTDYEKTKLEARIANLSGKHWTMSRPCQRMH
ncbi:MAG: chaperonin GroEL, partial [Victivallales bacterium]|nr:chaperonin GroEL [Victivallales bacterium]